MEDRIDVFFTIPSLSTMRTLEIIFSTNRRRLKDGVMKADWLGTQDLEHSGVPGEYTESLRFHPTLTLPRCPSLSPGSDVTEVMSVKSQAFTTNCLEVSKIIHLIKNQEDLKLNGERQPTDTKLT